MKDLLLNELEEELQRLKELREMWGKNDLHDDYLDGRLSAMEQVVDFIKQLELKLIFNELQKEIFRSKELKEGGRKNERKNGRMREKCCKKWNVF